MERLEFTSNITVTMIRFPIEHETVCWMTFYLTPGLNPHILNTIFYLNVETISPIHVIGSAAKMFLHIV
jgi:hypothetical protein